MFYPEEVVEEVRAANDIIDVISGYTALKQKGADYWGLCPFHNEKSPSFHVRPDKQLYHCFGCGASGNVISFIMQKENYNFPETLKLLADRVHYQLPEQRLSDDMKKQAEAKKTILAIHTSAARFFYQTLCSPDGRKAVDYLERRRIRLGTRRKFGLGYAMGNKSLYRHLKGEGYGEELIQQSGLVIPDKRGGYFDRFSGRLMFPIFDVQSRIIGFGGRILDTGEPKYLNSPETLIFDKGRNLYGIHFARQSRARVLFIVEGYMDVIALFQSGVQNAVAALGTAFTQEHAKLIKRYCESAVILFDSDAAGEKAALRAIPILTANGLTPKVLQLKDAKDPDEYLQRFGKDAFIAAAASAVSSVGFQIACARKNYDFADLSQKGRFTNETAALIADIPNAIERDIYIREASDMTGVSPEAIRQEVDKRLAAGQNAPPKPDYKNKPGFLSAKHGDKGLDEARRNILCVFASDAAIADAIKKHLSSKELLVPFYIELFETIAAAYTKAQTLCQADIVSHFESLEDQRRVSALFTVKPDYPDTESLLKALNQQLKGIKSAYIDAAKKEAIDADDYMKAQKLEENKRNLKNSYIADLDG